MDGRNSHSLHDHYEMHPRLSSEPVITVHDLAFAASRSSEDETEPLDQGLLQDASATDDKTKLRRLGFSFFLFGLINNVLYVIILSAALDLVPPSTPKGIIAFCNIAPALRLLGCCSLSSIGMLVVAFFDSLYARLLGICLASFSSGLGELTFLQLSTTYAPTSIAGRCIGYFASGTGAAGLVGAFLWWEVRGLGVRVGVGLSSVLPLVIPLTFFLLLPPNDAFLYTSLPVNEGSSTMPYTPLATNDDDEAEEGRLPVEFKAAPALSISDKWRLVKPLLAKYMLPLFCVYLFEYTINQGIAPTLLYPVPPAEKYWLLSKIIHSVRDYYPLWQVCILSHYFTSLKLTFSKLVYQTTVFLSRSSISLGLPPLPEKLLPLPAIAQGIILSLLVYESAVGVNTFYRINEEQPDPGSDAHDAERIKQEREFKIGSIGFADSSGILLASLVAVPTELTLCKAQVNRGKLLCKGL
ncbi:battenin CLN3 protein [Marasmius tenuissimus]|nr:battenin CLN3 protein [Marasmius tenuissimus]